MHNLACLENEPNECIFQICYPFGYPVSVGLMLIIDNTGNWTPMISVQSNDCLTLNLFMPGYLLD